MKKLGVMILSGIAIFSLVACNTKGAETKSEKNTGKSDLVSMKIDSGEYIVPQDEEATDSEGYLALNVTLTNETDKALDISSSDLMLYDEDDSKIESLRTYADEISKTSMLGFEKISAKKSKTGYIVFPVDKKAEYKLHFEPTVYDSDKEVKPIILDLDTSKYKDHSEDAIKAATAYIDEVFLAKENKEYDTMIVNDKEEAITTYDQNFTKGIKKQFYSYKPTDAEGISLAKVFRENAGKVNNVTYKISYFYPDSAVILVNVEGVTYKEMRDAVKDAEDQFKEANPDRRDYEQMQKDTEKAGFTKLPEIIAVTKPTSIDGYGDGFKMNLKKNDDDKWEVLTSGTGVNYDYLEQAFRADLSK